MTIIQRFREKVDEYGNEIVRVTIAFIKTPNEKERDDAYKKAGLKLESHLLTELQREKMEISERVLDYPDYAFCCGSCKSRILSKVVELIKKESI